jgi:hypothetical protein
MNNLCPRIKNMIMNGEVPGHLSVEKIRNYRFPASWKEQEMWFNPI